MKLVDLKFELPDVKGRKVTKGFGKAGGRHQSKKHKKRAKRKAEFRKQLKNMDY